MPRHAHDMDEAGAHGHNTTVTKVGNHKHNANVNNDNGHSHSSAPEGHHNHRVGDNGHQHNFSEEGVQRGAKYDGQGETGYKPSSNRRNTSTGHASIYCDGNGGHRHDISGGNHTHSANIGDQGEHGHSVAIQNSVKHKHTGKVRGGGESFNCQPAFIQLFPIIKT